MNTYRIRPAVELEIIVEPDDGREDSFHAICPKLGGLHVPGRTEEEALSNARNAARAHIKSLITHSGRAHEEAINALNRNFGYGKFERMVMGSMKSTVDAHGPVTKEFCNSAAKRVAHQTWSELKSILRNSSNLT